MAKERLHDDRYRNHRKRLATGHHNPTENIWVAELRTEESENSWFQFFLGISQRGFQSLVIVDGAGGSIRRLVFCVFVLFLQGVNLDPFIIPQCLKSARRWILSGTLSRLDRLLEFFRHVLGHPDEWRYKIWSWVFFSPIQGFPVIPFNCRELVTNTCFLRCRTSRGMFVIFRREINFG